MQNFEKFAFLKLRKKIEILEVGLADFPEIFRFFHFFRKIFGKKPHGTRCGTAKGLINVSLVQATRA